MWMVVRPVDEDVEMQRFCCSAQYDDFASQHTHVALHMALPSFVAVGQGALAQFQLQWLL
jgi:hypothetical protein